MKAPPIREDLRDRILDAVEPLLVRYGYAKMTMDDLAREIGVGKGTLYLHFPSKEEVVLSRIDRVIDRLLDQLRTLAAAKGDPAAKLREMLLVRVLFRFDGARRYAESIDEMLASIRAGLLARRERHFTLEAKIFAGVIADAFPHCDASAAAHAFINATNSLLPYSLTVRQLGRRAAVEEKVSTIATLLINGIRRRS